MVVRIVSVLIALVVAAWFALGVREAHELNRASAILAHAGPLRPAQRADVVAALDAAAPLNPDRSVDIARAQLQIREGQLAAAQRTLGDVISAEPKNLDAYYWLAKASAHRPALFLLALLKIRQLEPPVRSHR